LVTEAGVEEAEVAEAEVAETSAALVDEATDVPVDGPVEEPADETTDVAVVGVLLDAQLTALGTMTPAVVQICFAYATAAC
jgi:hypothetical protein